MDTNMDSPDEGAVRLYRIANSPGRGPRPLRLAHPVTTAPRPAAAAAAGRLPRFCEASCQCGGGDYRAVDRFFTRICTHSLNLALLNDYHDARANRN
jgi:hypothetical protein